MARSKGTEVGVFESKVAIVTGAGGIGKAVAKLFAAEGGKVLVVDLPAREAGTPSVADRAVDEIRAEGGDAVAYHATIGKWDAGKAIVKAAIDAFGRVDVLVSAAGNIAVTPIVDITEREWDSINDVHMKGQVSLVQAFARAVIARDGRGSVLLFSSRASFLAPTPAYAAAKAGVLGLTTSAAMELEEHGINVNAILPSAQTTLFPGEASSRPVSGGTPFVSDVDPAAIAPAVLFPATEAGFGITGRWIYAAGNDAAIYPRPLVLANVPTLLRGGSRWTLEGLEAVLPKLTEAQ